MKRRAIEIIAKEVRSQESGVRINPDSNSIPASGFQISGFRRNARFAIGSINRYYFNMIEVVLAMAIIAFGMTSILGLFPVGINASQNAIANNCGSDAVEQFMGYFKSYAETSMPPTTHFTSLFGTSSITGLLREQDQLATIRDAANTESQNFLNALRLNPANPAAPYSKIAGWQMYKSNYQALHSGQNPIYFVTQGQENTFPADFTAMIIAWKQPISSNVNLGTWRTISDSNYTQGAGLNIEISWPLEKSYADREKRYYYFEIKNP